MSKLLARVIATAENKDVKEVTQPTRIPYHLTVSGGRQTQGNDVRQT